MNLNLSIPKNIENVQPKISVIGVGGAGCNAVNTMINSKVNNINFIVANTDGQALSRSLAKTQIQLGKELTNGLGAGSDYTIGEQAAHETIDEIMMELEDVNPSYIEIEGWPEPTAGINNYDDFPQKAKNFVEKIAEVCGVPVDIVSTGPDDASTILINQEI